MQGHSVQGLQRLGGVVCRLLAVGAGDPAEVGEMEVVGDDVAEEGLGTADEILVKVAEGSLFRHAHIRFFLSRTSGRVDHLAGFGKTRAVWTPNT